MQVSMFYYELGQAYLSMQRLDVAYAAFARVVRIVSNNSDNFKAAAEVHLRSM